MERDRQRWREGCRGREERDREREGGDGEGDRGHTSGLNSEKVCTVFASCQTLEPWESSCDRHYRTLVRILQTCQQWQGQTHGDHRKMLGQI